MVSSCVQTRLEEPRRARRRLCAYVSSLYVDVPIRTAIGDILISSTSRDEFGLGRGHARLWTSFEFAGTRPRATSKAGNSPSTGGAGLRLVRHSRFTLRFSADRRLSGPTLRPRR